MAQPNVAREPSMEEILASIRRIIESNDPAAARDAALHLPPIYGGEEDDADGAVELAVDEDLPLAFSMEPANDKGATFYGAAAVGERRTLSERQVPAQASADMGMPGLTAQGGIASQGGISAQRGMGTMGNPGGYARNEPPMPQDMAARPAAAAPARSAYPQARIAPQEPQRPAAQQQASHAQAAQSKGISLADLAARVRASSERNEEAESYAPAPDQVRPEAMRSEPQREPEFAALRGSHDATSFATPYLSNPVPMQDAPVAAPAERQRNEAPVMQQAPVAQPARPQAAPADAAPPALSASIAEQATGQALLSLKAGDKVARSFQELAEAFDGSQRRSLEEMAEEMLRPMLQDWLDDNLPTLVERLVREEIERVARGPRR